MSFATGYINLGTDLFSKRLLSWYASHARSLPWRKGADPYAIWVSEVMLQQTRVETVIPYFKRWMQRFPTIAAVASAGLQEVLAAWEGLGYYGRARNLHRAAQIVMQDPSLQGELPADVRLLRKLPGIGRYTAAAIASIAFGHDEPTLDGNIRRVLARYFNVDEDARSTAGERRLWELAAQHLPQGRAGAYNQALMDLGAMVCTPRSPDCSACPLNSTCEANLLGIQEHRPVLLPKPPIPHYTVTAAVITREDRVLIACRPPQGLLGGLWEFPGGKQQDGEDLPSCLQREIREELGADIGVGAQLGVYQHAYTHFRVTLHAFKCRLLRGEPQPIQAADLRWVPVDELSQYPMGKIDRQISKTLVSSGHALFDYKQADST
jgi:A/G-specific adenine glycosylase